MCDKMIVLRSRALVMFGAAAALLLSTAACAPEPSWDTPDGLAFDDGKADGFAGTYRGVVFSLEEAKALMHKHKLEQLVTLTA